MSSSSTVHPSVGIGFHLVRLTLGGVLLAAAAFKAFALWTDPTPSPSLFSSPRWQIASIEGETLLGLWLLSGIAPRGAWAMALIAFGLLACVSLYLGSSGQSSCGCLGKVELVPWYVFDRRAVMNRIYEAASSLLGALGVALLLTSLLLVPQSLAVAQVTTPPRCDGMTCNLPPCGSYFMANGNCPNTCTKAGLQFYCQCVSDPTACPGCICRQNATFDQCGCFSP